MNQHHHDTVTGFARHDPSPEPGLAVGHGLAVEVAFAGPDGAVRQIRFEQAAATFAFEDLAPVAGFPVQPGLKWTPGWWWSAITSRHVAHSSAAMRIQFMVLDCTVAVGRTTPGDVTTAGGSAGDRASRAVPVPRPGEQVQIDSTRLDIMAVGGRCHVVGCVSV